MLSFLFRLSGVLGRYITTRLDDAEVTLTHAESSISRDDADYLDLEAAKKALDAFRVSSRFGTSSFTNSSSIIY